MSSKVKDPNSLLEAKFFNDKGEGSEVHIAPHKTTRNIASAWSVVLPESPTPFSFSLKSKDQKAFLFRDLFVHLNLTTGLFELPAPEIWVLDNTLIDNLTQVLN